MAHNTARSVVKVKVSELKAHPRQEANFPSRLREGIEELAEDIRRRGLQHPIEVLPDGTLVTGHRRTWAAEILGWEEIDAVVREDLAALGGDAVEAWLIEDNLNRRELTPLERARCYKRKMELAAKLPAAKRPPELKGDLRDVIGRTLGISGRKVGRTLQLLRLPVEVQVAVEDGRLPESTARAVERLHPLKQELVAAAISKGEDPRAAAARYVPKKDARHKEPWHARDAFFRALKTGLDDLQGRVHNIKSLSAENEATLRSAWQVIEQILNQAKVYTPAEAEARRGQQLQALAEVAGRGAAYAAARDAQAGQAQAGDAGRVETQAQVAEPALAQAV